MKMNILDDMKSCGIKRKRKKKKLEIFSIFDKFTVDARVCFLGPGSLQKFQPRLRTFVLLHPVASPRIVHWYGVQGGPKEMPRASLISSILLWCISSSSSRSSRVTEHQSHDQDRENHFQFQNPPPPTLVSTCPSGCLLKTRIHTKRSKTHNEITNSINIFN